MSLIEKAKAYTDTLLEKCAHYTYHNPHHTESVFSRAAYLAMAEWVEWEDLEDLQIAALFHDTGFTVQYEKNEYFGARIARTWLEEQWHDEKRIQKIERNYHGNRTLLETKKPSRRNHPRCWPR